MALHRVISTEVTRPPSFTKQPVSSRGASPLCTNCRPESSVIAGRSLNLLTSVSQAQAARRAQAGGTSPSTDTGLRGPTCSCHTHRSAAGEPNYQSSGSGLKDSLLPRELGVLWGQPGSGCPPHEGHSKECQCTGLSGQANSVHLVTFETSSRNPGNRRAGSHVGRHLSGIRATEASAS